MERYGEELARGLGYTIAALCNGCTIYSKEHISLVINPDDTATLEANVALVNLKVGPFSLPNKNFPMFERQIEMVRAAGEYIWEDHSARRESKR